MSSRNALRDDNKNGCVADYWGTGKWPLNGGSSEITIILSRYHFILKQTRDRSITTGPQLLVTFYFGLYFQSFSQNKAERVYQALDGRLIGVRTKGELSLGRPKGGRERATFYGDLGPKPLKMWKLRYTEMQSGRLNLACQCVALRTC